MSTLIPLYLAGVVATSIFFAWVDDEREYPWWLHVALSVMWLLVMPRVIIRALKILRERQVTYGGKENRRPRLQVRTPSPKA